MILDSQSSNLFSCDLIGMSWLSLEYLVKDVLLLQNKMSKHMRSLGKKAMGIKGKKKTVDKDQDSALYLAVDNDIYSHHSI